MLQNSLKWMCLLIIYSPAQRSLKEKKSNSLELGIDMTFTHGTYSCPHLDWEFSSSYLEKVLYTFTIIN